ncbi:unnamed protein product [Laminaria digitata]
MDCDNRGNHDQQKQKTEHPFFDVFFGIPLLFFWLVVAHSHIPTLTHSFWQQMNSRDLFSGGDTDCVLDTLGRPNDRFSFDADLVKLGWLFLAGLLPTNA